jgi:hypothetical protein
LTGFAGQERVIDAFSRLLPLTCLAPEVVEAILDSREDGRADGDRSMGWE